MFISVTPHRLSQHSQDVWLEVWIDQSVPLTVGRVLRFEDEAPFFGVISDLFEEDRTGSWLVRVSIVLGQPSLQSQFATMLSERDVKRLINQYKPAHQDVFSLSDGERGTLTLLDVPRHPLHRQILSDFTQAVMNAHETVLLIDPEGDWAKLPVENHLKAPEAFKLSIQEMGVPAFLALIGQDIPQPLQPDAFRILSRQVPATPDFIPLVQFLRPERIPELPVKAVLLHVMYRIYQENWFASHPDETMHPQDWLSESSVRLDLSHLEDHAKPLFYQQLMKQLLQALRSDVRSASGHPASGVVLILNQPERYLQGLLPTLSALQSLGASVVVLPQTDHEGLLEMAQNQLMFQSDELAIFEGVCTLGLPIVLRKALPKSLATLGMGLAEAESNLPMSDEEQADHARRYSQFTFPDFAEAPPVKSEPKKYAAPPVKSPPQYIPPPQEVSLITDLLESNDMLASDTDDEFETDPLPEPLDLEPVGLFKRGTEFKLAPEEDFWGDAPNPEISEEDLENSLNIPDPIGREQAFSHQPNQWGAVESKELLPKASLGNLTDVPLVFHEPDPEAHLWETPTAEMLYGENITDALSDNELTWDETGGRELKVMEGIESRPIQHEVWDLEEGLPEEGLHEQGTLEPDDLEKSDALEKNDLETQQEEEAHSIELDFVEPSIQPQDLPQQVVYPEEQIVISEEPYLMGGSSESMSVVPFPISPSPIQASSPVVVQAPTPQQQTIPVYKVLSDPMPSPDAQSQPGYKVGDRVKHDKYGFGSIHKVTPVDESVILHIIFDSVGKRLMDPTLTGITKL